MKCVPIAVTARQQPSVRPSAAQNVTAQLRHGRCLMQTFSMASSVVSVRPGHSHCRRSKQQPPGIECNICAHMLNLSKDPRVASPANTQALIILSTLGHTLASVRPRARVRSRNTDTDMCAHTHTHTLDQRVCQMRAQHMVADRRFVANLCALRGRRLHRPLALGKTDRLTPLPAPGAAQQEPQ